MIEWFHHAASDPAYIPVVVGWFAAIASLLGMIVSIVVARIGARTTDSVARRSVYINSVTSERSKWIEALRRSIADLAGAAERVVSRRQDPKYENSPDWATDVQSLRSNLANLKMRLNPREEPAKNLILAAHKVDQAARIHRWVDVDLATEIMVRHSQWVLKFEWNRVKIEAASGAELKKLKAAQGEQEEDYAAFLKADGSLLPLDSIGAGESAVSIGLLRSDMDAEVSSAGQKRSPL